MIELAYRVEFLAPGTHLFQVTLVVSESDPEGQVLYLPAWIPGSYMIRDFARNIVTLAAECEGAALPITKLDKQTWRCAPCDGPLTVRYQVYGWDLSVRSAHYDSTHAYFNGTSLFLGIPGRSQTRCTLDLSEPRGDWATDWRVETTLPVAAASERGFGRYGPVSYEELIDHPVEIGALTTVDFSVRGVPHRVAIYGRHRTDLERLARDLAAVCECHAELFGELPVERYLFLVMAVGEGYGGLEHRDSTSLICNRDDLPAVGEASVTEGYRRFLGLCSHEYFHLWNVKRIRPDVFVDPALDRELYTRQLWMFEGFTSYYDDLGLIRSGRIDEGSYLELLAQTVTRVMRGSGRFKQSLAESSFDAWTKFYKQDENAPNAIVSYYTKGALVALALDLTLRLETDGACSLDRIMRALWLRFGKTGVGLAEGELVELVQEQSGLDLGVFFDGAVHGTRDLPLKELLGAMGVRLTLRPAKDAKDFGGIAGKDNGAKEQRVLGLRLQGENDAVVSHVLDGGAAQEAGVAAGDQIVAVDGLRANAGNLPAHINRLPASRPVRLHLFRRDELMEFELIPRPAPADTCELALLEDAGEEGVSRRTRWLRGG